MIDNAIILTKEEYENVKNNIRNGAYKKGAREFAEWLPQHFDLRFSNNPEVWIDEFFNRTKEKTLMKRGN